MKTKKQLRAEAVERLRRLSEQGLCCTSQIVAALLSDACLRNGFEEDLEQLIDLLTDDEPQTNLEWLMENDFQELCDQMSGQPCSCCIVGCHEDLGSDEACRQALREWLMAERESQPALDVNIAKWNEERNKRITDGVPQAGLRDSREKLEADVCKKTGWVTNRDEVFCWLDRQAAITKREFTKRDELQAKVDELTRENARLSSDELKDRTRRLLRVMDECAGQLRDYFNMGYIAASVGCEQALCETVAQICDKSCEMTDDGVVFHG